jgi:GTP-binding protein HflX
MSSLFNVLTGSEVLVENKLFATLDPTMRRLELPGFGPIVLSDTVGFVRDLPHTLVAAFHSTLEEVASAACLLLVSDASDPDHRELRRHVELVLDEIGANEIPIIHVYNKIDLTGDQVHTGFNVENRVDRIWLSAATGSGVELVAQALAALLSKDHRDCLIRLKPQAGELRSRLFQRCEVIFEEVDEAGNILMKMKMEAKVRGWDTPFSGHIRVSIQCV